MAPMVNFPYVRSRVTLPMLVERYPTQLQEGSKGKWRGPCPIHQGSNAQQFVITPPNKWRCFGDCTNDQRFNNGGGNALDFVIGMESIDTGNAGQNAHQAALLIIEWFDLGEAAFRNANSSSDEAQAAVRPARPSAADEPQPEERQVESASDEACNSPLERGGDWYRERDYEHPYLTESRGLGKDTTRYFGIGHYAGKGKMMHNRIVIPIHNVKGEIVAFAGRRIIDDDSPKYLLPKGFYKQVELFNFHRVPQEANRVVLVEGYFDVFHLYQCGITHVVSSMGVSLSDAQLALLRERFLGVQVLFDGDATGQEASMSVAAKMAKALWVKVIPCPEGKQPEHLSCEELKELVV